MLDRYSIENFNKLEQIITILKNQNKALIKDNYELKTEIANLKIRNAALKACYNCKAKHCEGCTDFNHWMFVGEK